jgi:hypothetical protein
MTEFYQPASGLTFTEENLRSQTGFSPTTAPSTLAANGIYTINQTPDPYDPGLYDSYPSYTIVGFYADQSWVATPKPLPVAKENGSAEVKEQANAAEAQIVTDSGLSNEVLTGVASQDPVDRPAQFQAVLDTMAVVSDQLDANLTAIDAATSVDEINAIVHQPYGTIVTGRGGPGQAGPLDLNLSYFSAINDLPGFTQADLELYVPGTDTVIPYNASLPDPYKFDSAGNCFNSGDYRLVIRYAGAGAVLSTITVPQGANTNVAWTYNPVIPSLGGGSSSSSRA